MRQVRGCARASTTQGCFTPRARVGVKAHVHRLADWALAPPRPSRESVEGGENVGGTP